MREVASRGKMLAVPMSEDELFQLSALAADDEANPVEYAEFVLLNIALSNFSCFGPEAEVTRAPRLMLSFGADEYRSIEEAAYEAALDIETYARRLLLEVPAFVLPWHPRHPGVSE